MRCQFSVVCIPLVFATKNLLHERVCGPGLRSCVGAYPPRIFNTAQTLELADQLLAYYRSDGEGDISLTSGMSSDIALFGKAVVDGYREAGWFEDFASLNTAMEHVAQTLVPPYASRVFTGDIVGTLTKDPSFVFKHLVRTVTDPLNQIKIPEAINRRANQILVDQGLL